LSQRLRTLDESESRLKDVNWNLETQVRESETQFKSAADKERSLNHALDLARTERSTLEKELEDLKQMYTKLNDDHINKTKQHETELSSLRRVAAMTETEKGAMQRKVEELTSKNHELAQAIAYRARSEHRGRSEGSSDDDRGVRLQSRTPEHSPEPSPSKATPRHGMLESETLKHSLQHAHRMIQQLKNNIHREKTEKIELKRMLQDARDEVDATRALVGPGSASRRRKSDKEFKKPAPRPDRLGALRNVSQEIVEDDEWEEQDIVPDTPSRPPQLSNSIPGSFPSGFSSAAETSAYEGADTANETSDAAFETANERDGMATESDAFQTGAETLDGDSSDQLTETEAGPGKSSVRRSRPSISQGGRINSYRSTASASGDEYDSDFRTPLHHQTSRFRLKARDSSSRRSTPRGLDFFAGTPPASRESPAGYVSSSNENTPAQGKSLLAELNDLSGDDDDASSVEGSPSRSSVVYSGHATPDPLRKAVLGRSLLQPDAPKPAMVDSGTMTEADVPAPISISSISSQNTQPQAVPLPTLQVSALHSQDTSPRALPRPDLKVSLVSSQDTEPKHVLPQALGLSSVSGHATSPQTPRIPQLVVSSFSSQGTEPRIPSAPLSTISSLHAQDTVPRAVPITPLDMSSVSAHTTEPRHVAPPSLEVSAVSSQGTDPIVPVVEKIIAPSLDVSSISHQTTEPREAPAPKLLAPAGLFTSAIYAQSTEPAQQVEAAPVSDSRSIPNDVVSPSPVQDSHHVDQLVPLQMSSLSAHATEPRDLPYKPTLLQMSSLSTHATEPKDLPRAVLSAFSSTSTQSTEPLTPRASKQQFSELSAQATEPVALRQPQLQLSNFSARSTDPVEVPKTGPSQLSSLSTQASHPLEPMRAAPSSFSVLSSRTTEPIVPEEPTAANFSGVSSQVTEPVQPRQVPLQRSVVSALQTEPATVPVPSASLHDISDVQTVHDTQPESPTLPAFLPTPTSRPSTANRVSAPIMTLSPVATQGTEPLTPSRPVTAHRAVGPSVTNSASFQTEAMENKQVSTPKLGYSEPVLSSNKDVTTETTTPPVDSRDVRMPLTPVDANAARETPRTAMTDGGTQTMVSAQQIDKLLLARSQRWSSLINTSGLEKSLSPPESPSKKYANESSRTPKRPGSSGSMRSRAATPPPLPQDHKEVIAAASLKPISPGTMGPPTMPASAYKRRPHTPTIKTSNNTLTPRTGGTTPRVRRQSQRSGASSPLSRRSSLSSFTSEIDQRFNIPGGPSFAANGLPPGATDPRMIQAITQTMIGEYLWKYTRKTGREGMSENRHRRFFWIHPYTRTLYWSDRDPQSADKTTLKAKSVAIESVQEVDDPNPLPPGLHQKSLLVITPGRSMKFTAPTGQRHETWYNALNYLCQRVDEGEQQKSPTKSDQEQKAATEDEIQDEFNGGYRSSSRQTGRSRGSMASYATRRTSSRDYGQVPTIRQSHVTPHRATSTEPLVHGSVSSRINSMLRPSVSALRGSFTSRRNSRTSATESATYEEPSASNMDLSRDIHEHVERDQDFMPNVRACCDGKTLSFQ
jgi:predicted  nucleic acid-binding Zn-ribbon protein